MFLKMLLFFASITWPAFMLMFMGFQTKWESRRRSETEHTRATGIIVDYACGEYRNGHRRLYWKPVVEFTADGEKIHAEYGNSMDRNRFPIGTEVDIRYDVSDPLRFHLEMDPVFVDPGGGAIRISLIWIAASAVLTILLAVFVGGLRIDFRMLWHRLRLLPYRLRRVFRRMG